MSAAQKKKMYKACYKGRVGEVQQLLKEAPSLLNASLTEDGSTPLHYASRNGKTEVVRVLLASNANINKQDKIGWTPLHGASVFGQTEVVRVLLASNADPNKQDKNGSTPLHCASFNGYTEVVRVLLASNADPNMQDKDGKKPGDSFNRFSFAKPGEKFDSDVEAATKQEIQQLLDNERKKRKEAQQQKSTTSSSSSNSPSSSASSSTKKKEEKERKRKEKKRKEKKRKGKSASSSSPQVSETQEAERIGAIKCKFGEDAARFSVTKTTTFEELIAMVEGEWGEGKGLKFKDCDGDWLKMKNNDDVVEVWNQTKSGVVTLKVFSQQNQSSSSSSLPTTNSSPSTPTSSTTQTPSTGASSATSSSLEKQ